MYASTDQQPSYVPYVWETFELFNNINILLVRNEELQYQQYGRSQTLDEAIDLDGKIKNLLLSRKVPFIEYKVGYDSVHALVPSIKTAIGWGKHV